MSEHKSVPIENYDDRLSTTAKLREPSAIRALMPLLRTPGMISLGGGLPNDALFPFANITVKLKDDTTYDIDGNDLKAALQYSESYGIPPLVKQLKDLQQRKHTPPYASDADWHVIATTGSQDALSKAFEMLLSEGDSLLMENPTYSGALAGLNPLRLNLVGVETDGEGLIPESLESLLNEWPSDGAPRPRVLYTIPTGQNPSGATSPPERRDRIYQICCKHDIIILEDDPYWFLRLHKRGGKSGEMTYPSLRSYLSLDEEHRVIRFDSFSKVLSSGLRLGWATGPKQLIANLELHQQASELHTSGISQTIVSKLLAEWGEAGFDHHVEKVQAYYSQRANVFLNLCDKYLTGLATWTPPSAGMFVWFKINNVSDTNELIKKEAVAAKVLMVPGVSFLPTPTASPHVRAAFSTASDEQMEEALLRFSQLLKNKL
eukprot:TRINITY_DN9193_c0_g1_i1.p1 TRINITY_DN9193_c0_g1~~TRINITY_DN9193_c0_g1_i1.p1  ORF type:complete len:483 (-),score=116.72 TRINITY_DN9193_c0_g1_i1:111-1409(-)